MDSKKRKLLVKFFLAFPAVLAVSYASYFAYFFFRPDVSLLKYENPGRTEFMEHREKETGVRKEHRVWAPIGRVSPYLVNAVLIAEDKGFLGDDVAADGAGGLTRLLVRNLYVGAGKGAVGRLKGAIIAGRMEKTLSSERILELYLNFVEWGDGIYGVEAASRLYYGKRSSVLAPREAARLAAALADPRRYNPTGSSGFIKDRSEAVYEAMVKQGAVAGGD
jgi:monofunctional biosynthetic peptidoglycan transglycosylase